MHYCFTCGYQNPDGMDKCLGCGTMLDATCPTCGQPVSAASKFCSQCGTFLSKDSTGAVTSIRQDQDLATPPFPSPPISPVWPAEAELPGERREVTILFLDVVDFTAAAHTLDSEDVYLLIDEAMRLLGDIVYQYEGTIEKFTGDGLMALFGAPIMHENDPERAVRVALKMLSVLQPFRKRIKQKYEFDFQVRIGLNTGPVIFGQVGSDLHAEYMSIGNTVNLASRLENAAEPGTILVSFETYQRTRSLFRFNVRPPVQVKGIPQPMQVFRPLGLRARPGRVRGLPGLQSPMVGRAGDLARLQEVADRVQQQGCRHVVWVTGEAGLGKSRLVTEFQKYLVAISNFKVYQGNCLAYARSAPLWLVADMLRDIFDLSENEPTHLRYEALRTYLDQLELASDDVLPYLAELLGLTKAHSQSQLRLAHLDATMLQQQTHAALRQLFLAEARRRPTALIFEDLHWIDPASRSFLEYFLATTSEAPLLLVLVSRDVERHTVLRPVIELAEKEPARLVDLQLQALSAAEEQLLIGQLIPENGSEARQLKKHIIERAEGNPFYIEEMIRMLIDRGVLTSQADGWQVMPQAVDRLQEIPATVKGLILARFDNLPEHLRQILQKVAVVGLSFPLDLPIFNGTASETIATQLNELATRQFLVPATFGSEKGYAFRHALVQETIYDTLLKRDRRQIHAQVAQAIEHSDFWPADEQAEVLAHHYAESTTPARAIPYLIAAAENAAQRCANEVAVEHYRRTISLLSDQPGLYSNEIFRVQVGLGRALKFIGEFTEADQVLLTALHALWPWSTIVGPVSSWPILIDNLRELADVRQREGAYNEALTYLEAGLHLLGTTGAQEYASLWRSLMDRLAWVRFRQGNQEQAFRLALSALENLNSQEADDPITLASLYNTLGGVCWQQGKLTEAITYVEQSLQLYKELGYSWGMANTYNNLGILHDGLGNWTKAIAYYIQAYILHQSIGDFEKQGITQDNLGILYMVMGDHETARQKLETALAIRLRLGDTPGIAQSQVNLAHLAVVQARFEDAVGPVEKALALAAEIGSSDIEIHARWILALIQAEQGNLQASLELAETALQQAQIAGFLDEETNCCRVLGMLHTRAGEYTPAEIFFHQSIELARRINNPYLHGLALLELGRMYQRQLSSPHRPASSCGRSKAQEVLGEAIAKFVTLGAAHDLYLAQTTLEQLHQEDDF